MLPLLLATAALAQDTRPPLEGWSPNVEVRGNLSFVRLGLLSTVRGGVSHPLWDQPGSALFGKTFVTAWAEANASPAYLRVGPRVSFEPIAIFNLQAFAWHTSYFGNFQTVIGFDEPGALYGTNEDLEAFSDRQVPGSSITWGVAPTIKAKAGPVVIALSGEYTRWNLRSELEGDYWFEREYELLIGRQDAIWSSNAVLAYELNPSPDDGWYARVGSITTYRKALGDTQDVLLRTGLLASLSTHQERWTHSLLVQPYLIDRAYTRPFPPFIAYLVKWTL